MDDRGWSEKEWWRYDVKVILKCCENEKGIIEQKENEGKREREVNQDRTDLRWRINVFETFIFEDEIKPSQMKQTLLLFLIRKNENSLSTLFIILYNSMI